MAGPAGAKGVNWRGAWNENAFYELGDAVAHNGASWFNTEPNEGNAPGTAPVVWALLAAKGDTGPAGPQGPEGTVPANVAKLDVPNAFTGNQTLLNGNLQLLNGNLTMQSGSFTLMGGNLTVAGNIKGNGIELFNLRAESLAQGTLDDQRLSPNVALRAGGNLFDGQQIFNGPVFLGSPLDTVAETPLELRAGSQRVLWLGYAASGNYTGVNTLGGYAGNTVLGTGATVFGGGTDNGAPRPNQATASFATVSGGVNNTASAEMATVGGGNVNVASSPWATVGGGVDNTSSGNMATIGGGQSNRATGDGATIPGGTGNAATTKAFAAGTRAKANHTGAFVWADATDANFASTADNQFLVRAGGGVGINTSAPGGVLGVNTANGQVSITDGPFTPELVMTGGPAPGILRVRNALEIWNGPGGAGALDVRDVNGVATIGLNGGTGVINCVALNQTSDRNAKENFTPVDSRAILDKVAALPISRWNFKQDREPQHVGPMAQDFHAAFGLGTDERHIATVDADGVALAAIQGLNDKVEERSRKLESENAELKRELAELKELVGQLAGAVKGGAR